MDKPQFQAKLLCEQFDWGMTQAIGVDLWPGMPHRKRQAILHRHYSSPELLATGLRMLADWVDRQVAERAQRGLIDQRAPWW